MSVCVFILLSCSGNYPEELLILLMAKMRTTDKNELLEQLEKCASCDADVAPATEPVTVDEGIGCSKMEKLVTKLESAEIIKDEGNENAMCSN